jgi:hypothetical protein
MRWSHLFMIRNYTIFLKVQILKKLETRAEGVASRVVGTTRHVTFLDYDDIDDYRLLEELQHLQDEKMIGNFYVFETRSNGRHAVCIDALPFRTVKDIIDYSSCDLAFKRGPRLNEYRSWVLRYTKKGKNRDAPKYVYKVESPYEGKNLQSLGHATYLLNFGVKIDLKQPYGPNEIESISYNTGHRVEEEPESTEPESTETDEV